MPASACHDEEHKEVISFIIVAYKEEEILPTTPTMLHYVHVMVRFYNLLYNHVVVSHTAASSCGDIKACAIFLDRNLGRIAGADFSTDQLVSKAVANFSGNEPVQWPGAEFWIVASVT